MPSINVALIGYAFMGKAHSNAYRQVAHFFSPRLTPRMKVICGRTPAKVKAAARELGWEEAATDWREVVNRDDIDLVDIATPGDSHAEIAIAAARAGKAVLCEKPLGNTVPEAERMLAAVTKAGVTHMICHNYRRIPAVMLAKQLIASGQLGEIRHYRGTYLQDWITDPKFPLVWRLDKKQAGSGALGDIAAHSIDLARFLVGEITEVAGDLKTFVKTRPLPGDPKKTRPRDRGRRLDLAGAFQERRDRDDRGQPHGAGTEELQPLRDQRQPGQPGVRPGADERARGLLRGRQADACAASARSS